MQKANPILQDVRVRRALLMSIDRQTINTKLFGGMDLVPNSFVSPRDEHYDADIPAVPYDPTAARKLLAEAGWIPGPDGVCRNAAGDCLSFELLSTAGVRYREPASLPRSRRNTGGPTGNLGINIILDGRTTSLQSRSEGVACQAARS